MQLWAKILQKHPQPSFAQKSVVQLWSQLNSHLWKQDDEEVRSARILLEEHQNSPPDRSLSGLLTKVEPIPIEEEIGVMAIAFTLLDILCQWGGRICEVQLDSACEFELDNYCTEYVLMCSVF